MSFDAKRLYELLPAIYRIRDSQLRQSNLGQSDSLKALLAVVAEQAAVLEENIEQLYDDLFIETCAEWVVPYIGDLVGTRSVFVFPGGQLSQRAQVANTIAYRRRKGTAAVLEQLARDVTGWTASVVEYFELLAATQYMNHLRAHNLSITSVRRRFFGGLVAPKTLPVFATLDDAQWERIERSNTPFDTMPRTVDVRRIEAGRGLYNIPNIGVFLWRLANYPVTGAPAFKVDDRRYKFDSLGKDIQLYNRPETEEEITHLARPANVPIPLARRIVGRHFETFYGVTEVDDEQEAKSILLFVDGQPVLLGETSPPGASSPPSQISDLIRVCDLRDDGSAFGWAHEPQENIAIDPVLGRIAFPPGWIPSRVHTSYHYGFSADMGGGEYGRGSSFTVELEPKLQIPSLSLSSIQDAVSVLAATGGSVEILKEETNRYYVESPALSAGRERHIEVRGADEYRPVVILNGSMSVTGEDSAEVTLNGLLICGGRIVVPATGPAGDPNRLRILRLRHCTLLPGPSELIETMVTGASPPPGPVTVDSGDPVLIVAAPDVAVEIDHSIVGAIRVVETATVSAISSIVDGGRDTAVSYCGLDEDDAGGPLTVRNTTMIGKVRTRIMDLASNSIFFARLAEADSWRAPVEAIRLQDGCVRFSYVPPGSKLPRLFECQPADPGAAARVRPVFTSLRYGSAGYCQLSPHCAIEIRAGADDRAEMGAFHDLYQPQRIGNLRTRLDEYLRVGLEAGILNAS
jgi:hypothetical protein